MKSFRFPSRYIVSLAILGILAHISARYTRAVDVLTQHYNNARTGATLDETTLNTANVSSGTFGKLWTLYTDGQVVAQPLYVSALTIDTSGNPNAPLVKGTFNAVIIATMHNTVYVYDADKENRGPQGRTTPLWATWLGPPRLRGVLTRGQDCPTENVASAPHWLKCERRYGCYSLIPDACDTCRRLIE